MKTLNDYLTESAKVYEYRIKVAGELPSDNYDAFKAGLDKFSVQSCSKPKKTPIQKDPVGFPDLSNQEINIFDIVIEYPASIQQVTELARIAGLNLKMVVVIDKAFNDSMTTELQGVEPEGTVRLDTPEYPKNTQEQNDANDAYADSYKEAAAEVANSADTDFEVAGGKTPPAKFNTDAKSGGDKSPMSNTKRTKLKDLLK